MTWFCFQKSKENMDAKSDLILKNQTNLLEKKLLISMIIIAALELQFAVPFCNRWHVGQL